MFNQHFLHQHFPTLAKKISKIRHTEKHADALFEGLGIFLMKERVWLKKIWGAYEQNIKGHTHTGYVDVKLLV